MIFAYTIDSFFWPNFMKLAEKLWKYKQIMVLEFKVKSLKTTEY